MKYSSAYYLIDLTHSGLVSWFHITVSLYILPLSQFERPLFLLVNTQPFLRFDRTIPHVYSVFIMCSLQKPYSMMQFLFSWKFLIFFQLSVQFCERDESRSGWCVRHGTAHWWHVCLLMIQSSRQKVRGCYRELLINVTVCERRKLKEQCYGAWKGKGWGD